MTSSSTFHSSSPQGGRAVTLRASLHAGLLVGFLLGVADAVQIATQHGLRFGLGGWLGVACQAIAVYVAAFTGVALLLSPVVHLGFRSEPIGVRARHAFALTAAMGIFIELFWWTRPYVFYGRPSTSPERLFSAFVMLVASWALGAMLSRLIARRSKRFRHIFEGAAWLSLTVGVGGFLFAPDGLGLRGELNERNRKMPNVLLVVVDALRQDVLGCYGNERVKTPVIDGLAERGVLFENAQVQAPFTWTSFGSLLTGKYPRRHGLMKMKPGVVMAPNETLAWHLKKAPIRGGAETMKPNDFASGTFMTGTLSQGSGLMRGFDAYFEALVGHELVDSDVPWSVLRSDLVLFKFKNKLTQHFDSSLVVSTATDWLIKNKGRRFLAMVHLYSTHTPYAPEPEFRDLYVDPEYDGPISSFSASHRKAVEMWDKGVTNASGKRLGYKTSKADREQIRNLYFGGVTQADAAIGEVLRTLSNLGELENTLVVITSDHGEELGEHGLWEHNWMYETNLAVPLVMSWPKGLPAGKRIRGLVESVDVVPTISDLLGIEVPFDPAELERGRVDGHSLVPQIRGKVPSEDDPWRGYAFAENGRYVSVRDLRWKLIVRRDGLEMSEFSADSTVDTEYVRRPRLFDLETDPGELNNLWRTRELQVTNDERALGLLAVLLAWSNAMPIPISSVDKSHRDVEDDALFEMLGYTDGVGADE